MSKLRVTLLVAVVPLLILLTDRSTRGEMSGDRGRPIVMQGTVAGDDGRDRCRFSIEIERVSFLLNAVQGRYKLARVRFENLGTTAVTLSVDRDRVEAEMAAGAPVPALLNVQSGDSPFWDGLSVDLRQILAYPQTVKPRPDGAGASPEVVYVYALFPADRVTEVPRAFTYRIDSIGPAVRIEHRATAALP
jgi:hypothetical protein